MLCNVCQTIFQSQAKADELQPHTPTLGFLQDSAQKGCHICSLLEEYLHERRQTGSESLDAIEKLFPFFWQFSIDDDPVHKATLTFLDSSGKRSTVHFDIMQMEGLRPSDDQLPKITDSPQSWALIHSWLDRCSQNHSSCSAQANWIPTRLLDLRSAASSGEICLVVSNVEGRKTLKCVNYMTLSHCWGSAQFIKLLQSNLSQLQRGIRVSELPKTFQHAVEITGRLGIQYLWIDSLCIVQDSRQDWLQEAAMMSRVYGNSYLNISAAGAEDSTGGCFFERNPASITRSHINTAWQSCSGQFLLVPERWDVKLSRAKLNTRAWVLQERLLSPRVLHFGKEQLIWECNEHMACELFPTGIPWGGSGVPLSSHLKDFLRLENWKGSQGDWLGTWEEIVRTYTMSSLTVLGDRLIALAGIVSEVVRAQIKSSDDYLTGMWKSDLPRSLLWYVQDGKQGNGNPSFRPKDYRAPTWSWASVEGDINILGRLEADEGTTLVNVLEIHEQETDLTGTVTSSGGRMRVRGPLGKATWEECCPDTSAGATPRFTSVEDSIGHSWPCLAFDHAVYNTIYFDEFEKTILPDYLFCLAVAGQPASGEIEDMILVNGLVLDRLPSGEFKRVGAFSIGSLYQLDFTPGFQNPKFKLSEEQTITIL